MGKGVGGKEIKEQNLPFLLKSKSDCIAKKNNARNTMLAIAFGIQNCFCCFPPIVTVNLGILFLFLFFFCLYELKFIDH